MACGTKGTTSGPSCSTPAWSGASWFCGKLSVSSSPGAALREPAQLRGPRPHGRGKTVCSRPKNVKSPAFFSCRRGNWGTTCAPTVQKHPTTSKLTSLCWDCFRGCVAALTGMPARARIRNLSWQDGSVEITGVEVREKALNAGPAQFKLCFWVRGVASLRLRDSRGGKSTLFSWAHVETCFQLYRTPWSSRCSQR